MNKNFLKKWSGREGFSLFEILLVISGGAFIIFILASFSNNLNVLKNLVGQKLQSRTDVEQMLQVMTTDIRSAGPSNLGGYPIDAATTTSFIFYSDINKDGLFYRVRYFVGTSTIQKGLIKPVGNPIVYSTSSETVSTVITNIAFPSSSQPVFTYYDALYTGSQPPLATPVDITKIKTVGISLYVNTSTGTAPAAEFFTIMANIRNLRKK